MRTFFTTTLRTYILLGFLWSSLAATAQSDTVTVSEEEMSTSTFDALVNGYNKVIRADKEELRLLKIDLLGPVLYAFANRSDLDTLEHNLIGLTYEQKINPSWSWIVGGTVRASEIEVTQLQFEVGSRYYYNLRRRMLKGRSGNNFSANYLGVSLFGASDLVNDDFQGSLRTMGGIQRRLGKYGYVDFNLGLEAIYEPFDGRKARLDTFIRVAIGIGLSL